VRPGEGLVSPRLRARFELTEPEMTIYRPDGRPFLSFEQLEAERVQAIERAEQAEKRAQEAEAEVERLRRLLDATRQAGEQK